MCRPGLCLGSLAVLESPTVSTDKLKVRRKLGLHGLHMQPCSSMPQAQHRMASHPQISEPLPAQNSPSSYRFTLPKVRECHMNNKQLSVPGPGGCQIPQGHQSLNSAGPGPGTEAGDDSIMQ